MSDILEELIGRQFEIARGEAEALPLPRFDTYTICNLRGGIGKTSLAFNLAYLADEILAVDTCPQIPARSAIFPGSSTTIICRMCS